MNTANRNTTPTPSQAAQARDWDKHSGNAQSGAGLGVRETGGSRVGTLMHVIHMMTTLCGSPLPAYAIVGSGRLERLFDDEGKPTELTLGVDEGRQGSSGNDRLGQHRVVIM